MDSYVRALKRLGRYIVAYAIAGGIKYTGELLTGHPWTPLVQPAIAALIAGLGKYIRERWDIRVPF